MNQGKNLRFFFFFISVSVSIVSGQTHMGSYWAISSEFEIADLRILTM